jgi:hypothetical protein
MPSAMLRYTPSDAHHLCSPVLSFARSGESFYLPAPSILALRLPPGLLRSNAPESFQFLPSVEAAPNVSAELAETRANFAGESNLAGDGGKISRPSLPRLRSQGNVTPSRVGLRPRLGKQRHGSFNLRLRITSPTSSQSVSGAGLGTSEALNRRCSLSPLDYPETPE